MFFRNISDLIPINQHNSNNNVKSLTDMIKTYRNYEGGGYHLLLTLDKNLKKVFGRLSLIAEYGTYTLSNCGRYFWELGLEGNI